MYGLSVVTFHHHMVPVQREALRSPPVRPLTVHQGNTPGRYPRPHPNTKQSVADLLADTEFAGNHSHLPEIRLTH